MLAKLMTSYPLPMDCFAVAIHPSRMCHCVCVCVIICTEFVASLTDLLALPMHADPVAGFIGLYDLLVLLAVLSSVKWSRFVAANKRQLTSLPITYFAEKRNKKQN